MRTNSAMRSIFPGGLPGIGDVTLPDDALEILEGGWRVGPQGMLILSRLWPQDGPPEVDAQDVGEYEYDHNDVYLSLSDLAGDESTYLRRAAERGIAFASRLIASAVDLPGSDRLVGVVSVFVDTEDELFGIQGVRPRFFTQRGRRVDFFDDLERYKQAAIAVLDQSDVR